MSAEEVKKFGTVLKSAREEKNISVVQISEALKLSLEKIESIEASDISSLPPAAFTCGYLRLFAKTVGLDEKEIIHLYNVSMNVEDADAIPGSVSDLPTQANSNDLGMRIVSYSMGLIAIVLFVLWFQSNQKGSENINTDVEMVSNEKVDAVNETNDTSLILEQSVEPKIEVLSITESINEDANNSVVEDIVETVIDPVKTSKTEEATADEIVVDVEDIQRDKNIALAREANPIAASGTDVIDLLAKDDCWIEISDANNHLLYFSLLKKGEKAQLKGQEPFSVFLGKATAVEVTLNEIKYNISKYVRSNQIARFSMSMDGLI